MKNVAIAVLLLTTLVFGGLYLQQTRKTIEVQTSADSLNQKVANLEAAFEEQEKQSSGLRQQLDLTRAEASAETQKSTQLQKTIQQISTNRARGASGSKSQNPLSGLAKIFNDPEMKEAIKSQQKAALGPMIEKNYSKLFSDLRLTPEQTATLKDLLLNKQLAATEGGMSILDDSAGTNRLNIVQQIKANSDAADNQIREFLGEANYTQLKEHEKGMSDRMALNRFKDQLGQGNPLSLDQEQRLTEVMAQQRKSFKFTTDFSGAGQGQMPPDLANMFNEERMNQYFLEAEQLNQQYLDQAKNILAPEQLDAFRAYLKNQQALQKAGMQMATKLFKPE